MSVRERIVDAAGRLTAAERRLSASLLSDYPYAGLEPIQVLAERVSVSSPSVSRFVNKLGYQGYQEFQRELITELKEGRRSPVDLMRARGAGEATDLRDFAARATRLIETMTRTVPDAQFRRVCEILGDPRRRVFVLGGRVTDLAAQHLSRHLRRMRDDVAHLSPDPETWPEALLRMRRRDVLFLVDFRRYQGVLAGLAETAALRRRVELVVLTDQWMSPASAFARETLVVSVDSGTVWDSYAAAFTLIEAMLARVAESDWDNRRRRIEAWDSFLTAPRGAGDADDS